jgi:hypothetical protein
MPNFSGMHAIKNVGVSIINTTWSNKFAPEGCVVFDQTGDYLTANDSDLSVGTSDFTVECFFKWNGNSGNASTTRGGLYHATSSHFPSNNNGHAFGIGNSGKILVYHNGQTHLLSEATIAGSTWYHIAVSRASGTSKVFLNGTQILSRSDTTNYSSQYLVIAGWYSTSFLFNGRISNFRYIVGSGIYTSNFTAPNIALGSISNTELLTCRQPSGTIADDSFKATSVTTVGNSASDTDNPFS